VKKKLLMLGGSPFQTPAIRYAKSAGYHVITCDYLPDNPGHQYADEYHNVSTTDKEAVLALASECKVDGVLAYASDPAASTAAYVGNLLGLPSNPYESVNILTNKDLYRRFLRDHGFPAPRAWVVEEGRTPAWEPDGPTLPVMTKPVDSSGSKGVSKVTSPQDISSAIEDAMRFSRAGRVIVEEYIVREGPQIGGEAFVWKGNVVFMCLGDQAVDPECNPYVPTGMLFPSLISNDLQSRVRSELQRLMDLFKFSFGGLNLEIMVDRAGRLYLMEVGPRTGGNFLPELMQYCAGSDIARCSVESALGHDISDLIGGPPGSRADGAFAYYAIHSRVNGTLQSLELSPTIQRHILEKHMFKRPGDRIEAYNGSNCTVGILLLRFDNREQASRLMAEMGSHVVTTLE